MKRLIISACFPLLFNLSYGGKCDRVGEVVIHCFKNREINRGQICKNPPFKEEHLKKACQMGCMAESLYEANMTAEMLKGECR